MNKVVLIYFIGVLLISCKSKESSSKKTNIVVYELIKSEIDTVPKDNFIDFPIPELDSILPYFETSGAVENSPSERFHNPTDTGIFVFYTLFDKRKNSEYSFDEINIGRLTTHTYRKSKYGWAATDKDQTFILLHLNGQPITIGKTIQIGITFKNLIKELGKPIYQIDSTFIFLGKNKIVGQFNFNNQKLESLTYGRFNLMDEIFEIDSISRKEIIEEKLKR